MEERFNRFKDAPWFSGAGEDILVIVGGAGGIGSWLSLLLTRASFVPVVYDFDLYEVHNMGGQLCRHTDVGKPKVEAIRQTIMDYCDKKEIHIYNEAYIESTMTNIYVFSGFDNMKARYNMYHKWKEHYASNPAAIFIDGRLTAEQLQIFCIVGGDTANMEKYEKEHLFLDEDVAPIACTFKQTSHAAAMIASHMVGFFTNHITNVNVGKSRSVPFFWEYLIPIDYLTVE